MAEFQRIAPGGTVNADGLSADNAIPPLKTVLELLRHAAPGLGLKPPVLATLSAMICCLGPKRTHHMVFASNATLAARLGGVSERTLRRHFAILEEAGLIERHDSPNGKRFTKHNPRTGTALRFGFDLSPLFRRLRELASLAEDAIREAEEVAYLRARLRSALHTHLENHPEDHKAEDALKSLRRKLTKENLRVMEAAFCPAEQPVVSKDSSRATTSTVSGNDGHSVRHHKNDKREFRKKECSPVSVDDLIAACPETAAYSAKNVRTVSDVIAHAETLAPLAGIDTESYGKACMHLGRLKAAVTVWAIVQMGRRIRKVGAYFRALTIGPESSGFDPFDLVRRLGREVVQNHCPRTIPG